ncbi:MAG TPA: hypothetical protein VNN79_13430, partial [Actinomycetota bacterium]|nr:hypothetical protein [Actinomycetota bacterium]
MDPKTGELLAAYPLDLIVGSGDAGPPGGRMIASDGALWVINGGYGTASLLKVDPASGAVQEKVTFGATFVNG